MSNKYFQFKQFKIVQNKAAMKVGTDGVLLGAWADCSEANTILDIGTGTGLIALMLAQRSAATVKGIDLDQLAIDDALININQSPWFNRIDIQQITLQEYAKTTDHTFDLIVSNPPFFENSLKAESESRTKARHTDSLSSIDLLKNSAKLLSSKGKCCFIIPADSHIQFIKVAEEFGLFRHKTLWVKPTPNKPAKRILLEFTKQVTQATESFLIIEEFGRHHYSQDYINLTKDFYLKM